MQLWLLVALSLLSGAGALRTGSRPRQLDVGHADIQSWCNTTLPLQTARQNGLQVLLQKAEQAAEQDTELAKLRQEVQSLAADAEAFESRMLSAESRGEEQHSQQLAESRVADIDVKVLSSARDQFLATEADLSKKLLSRGAKTKQEGFNVRKQLADLLAAAEKRAVRLKTEEKNATVLKALKGSECAPCEAKRAAEARLQDAEHEYSSAKRSLALSAAALQEEAVYLTDVQSICSADSSVHQRLHGSQLRLLRQVLEGGPSTSRAVMASSLEASSEAVTTEAATVAARTTAAVTSSTELPDAAALDAMDDQSLDASSSAEAPVVAPSTTVASVPGTRAPLPTAAAAAEPSTTSAVVATEAAEAPTEDALSTDDDTVASAALATPTVSPRPVAAKKSADGKQATKKNSLVNPSTALGMLQQALQSPAGTDPSLPNQYAVWSPTDPTASASTALDQEIDKQNAGASWANDFKKQLMGDMDDDDGDATTVAPQHARRGHRKHRHDKHTTTLAVATSVAPTPDTDDMDLTFPTAATTTAAAPQDDDDLKPQKAPDLGGGLESFLATHSTGHAAQAPQPTKSDADLQIIQNLYTADGHLPTQYTAWTPSLVQLSAASNGNGRSMSAQDIARYVLQQYAQLLNSKALGSLASEGNLTADGVAASIEALQQAGSKASTSATEAVQWCSLFIEKEKTASSVLGPLHRHENSTISAIQAEAQLAALHEELDTRTELKKSIVGDITELERLLQKQHALSQANASGSDSSYAMAAEAMEAIQQEVFDALQDAMQRRQAAAVAQEQSLGELKQELVEAQKASDDMKSKIKETANLLQTSRAQVSGIWKTCEKAERASRMHQQQAEDEAHALGIVFAVLQ